MPVDPYVAALNNLTDRIRSLENQSIAGSAFTNLCVNGSLDVWQRGNGPFTSGLTADQWRIAAGLGSAVSVVRDTSDPDVNSTNSAEITYSHGQLSRLFQNVEAFIIGYTVSLTMRVKCSVPNAVRGCIDGIYTQYHSGSGQYETLVTTGTAKHYPPEVCLYLEKSCVVHLDNVMLVNGGVPASYNPEPSDQLIARCQRYYETIGAPGDGTIWITGYAAAGLWITQFIPFKAKKAVIPTVTVQGTWQLGGTSLQPQIQVGASVDGFTLAVDNSGGAQQIGARNLNNGYITAEALF